ncbi:ABC transporter ATP-binding protein [Chelativorans sp. J32]|mgnify:CR=1 FL=1|uniref:ABC transporter ATP-binding protein n=1 Tax=Chelativorans sp. J32 TaxID=935840 RepID=UPI000A04C064|nr:ABC transporter ATP-binding protein [Chelativorans sp. J32]
MVSAPRVSVRNLTKVYRTRRGAHVALDNVSLDIDPAEFVVLLGPSGCGKTTLLRCIAGLEEPDSGEILIDGKVVFSSKAGIYVPPEKRHLSMVFQSYALWPHMSVLENVIYPIRNSGKPQREAARRAQDALDKVGLGKYAAAYPGQLSGGQQQRVALARAIVSGDGLVLFDEPLSNLDAKVRERLRLELLSLQSQIGFAAVYVTHDQTEALALANRIAVMDVGTVAQIGAPEEIYDHPVSRYVADFVGSANELEGTVVGTGDALRVRTAFGELKSANFPKSIAEGQKVSVMIRPEHCDVAADANIDNRITGRLVRSLYLGAVRQHFLETEGGELLITTQAPVTANADGNLTVTCPPLRVHVFAQGT